MEEFNIHEVAEENNLDVISTTTGKNGYPQSVRYAITGFPNFSEAEKLAEKYGLRITTFWKKAGWQLYVRDRNTTFEPMRISAENYGDDYMAFDSSSVESFYEDEVKPYWMISTVLKTWRNLCLPAKNCLTRSRVSTKPNW